MNNLRTSPQVPAKTSPPLFFHGAFAPSFIWRRRPCDAGQSPTFSPPGYATTCLRPANQLVGSPASSELAALLTVC